MARMPATLAWTLLAAIGAQSLCAPTAGAQTEQIRSLVARVDFEGERATGEEVPRGWTKSLLPGAELPQGVRFPPYVVGQLTGEKRHDGSYSFHMALDGGNVAYTYTAGLPAFSDSDYVLTGWVRTERLRAARAQLRLFLVDATGEVVPYSVCLSEPMGEPGGPADGEWQFFEVHLRGQYTQAQRLQITLSLIQPELWRPGRGVQEQDIKGEVWWDELCVYRLPRIRLRADAPMNVFAPGYPPRLKVLLEGLDQVDCGAVLTVRSAAGAVCLQRVIEQADAAAGEWVVELPDLPPGEYVAELTISAAGSALSRRQCPFICLAEVPLARATGLGLDVSGQPLSEAPVALELGRVMAASRIKLPAWPLASDAREDAEFDRLMRSLLSRLHAAGVTPTLVMAGLPARLAEGRDRPPTLLEAMADREKPLAEAVALAQARYGHRSGAWQLGQIGDEQALWSQDLPAAYQVARAWTAKLLYGQPVILPWTADMAYGAPDPAAATDPADTPQPAELAVRLAPEGLPEEIPDQLAVFGDRVDHVHLQPAEEQAERLARLGDFALRYAYVRAAGVQKVTIDPPWRLGPEGTVEPTELLIVARTLAAYLGEAECLGIARLSDTAVAVLFRAHAGEGRMLVYDRGGGATGAIPIALPQAARAVDLWGRVHELSRCDGKVQLSPKTLPMLVVGCEADVLALRAKLRFTPAVLPSVFAEHAGELSFVNPFGRPVSGTVRLRAPDGWTVRPRVLRFSLTPGQRWVGELKVRFPYSAPAGLQRMLVTLDVDAREDYRIEAPAFFYLGLEEIAFDSVHAIEPDGNLHVLLTFTNRGRTPVSFDCYAQVPDDARQSAVVHNLAPGATAEKAFRFSGGRSLYGKTIRSGLREIDGRTVLNHAAVIR